MEIYSWGSNSHGQLGQGIKVEQLLIPTHFEIDVEAKCITGGGKHTVILTTNNEILSCGDNDRGQLGKDLSVISTHRFQSVLCPYKIIKITCGWDFNLALTENWEVLGWGSNSFGQLGLPVKKVTHLSAPFKIFPKKAANIAAGLRHSLVITPDGSAFASGYGRKGQLGLYINGAIPIKQDSFQQVKNITNCEEISCGECHCIAKTKNGEFYSWGNNRYGQLGINPESTTFNAVPVKISLPSKTSQKSQLFSGWAHNCILTETGVLITWGRNDFGQLGEETSISWQPKIKKFDKKIHQVSLGSHHTVVVMESGEVMTWGWNEHGNCGNNSCENVRTPFKINNFVKVKLIGSGAAHSFICIHVMLEISDSNLIPNATEDVKEIPLIDKTVDYDKFFQSFLLSNKPCLIKDVSMNWSCSSNWIQNKSLNVEYFRNSFKNVNVPVSNCGMREYNAQKKCTMPLYDYLDYWQSYKKSPAEKECLYLKDWHFVKEFANENIYQTPSYFASDWLNEYYDNNSTLNEDYRFVYIGPKTSWTPFHADVFTSFSWSVNICGRKNWIFVPPGKEKHLTDKLGNLKYDLNLGCINELKAEKCPIFNIVQEVGQAVFVPSGWHHQVWNLEDTISINHNWINGCNIHFIWNSLKKNLSQVKKEISDCKDMENWDSQCQLILSCNFGFNYEFFYLFLLYIAKVRMKALKASENFSVYGNWSFGEKHIEFDLKNALKILYLLEKDDDFIETVKPEENLNHSLEFLDSLNGFVKC